MSYRIYFRIDTFLCLFLIMTLILISPAFTHSQEKFLLTEAEMPGFILKRQSNFIWTIGEGKQHDIIIQKWQISGTDKNYYIDYCEFNTEADAILGTAYASGTNSIAYVWGNTSGSIKGDGSWISSTNGSLYFVRGNVGINVFKPFFKEEDRQVLESIADKLLNKIETNLSPEILDLENATRLEQIPNGDYLTITSEVISSSLMSGFSHLTTWDSKWLFNPNSFTMGIRKEWKNQNGSVVGIDLCKFDTDADAKSAAEIQARNAYSRVFNLDDLDSLRTILEKWKNKGKNFFAEYNFSVIGVKQNITLHFYQFDTTGIDTGYVYSLVKKLAEQIVNF